MENHVYPKFKTGTSVAPELVPLPPNKNKKKLHTCIIVIRKLHDRNE